MMNGLKPNFYCGFKIWLEILNRYLPQGKAVVPFFALLRVQFAPFGGQPVRFPYRRLAARQRGKRRELCGSVADPPSRSVLFARTILPKHVQNDFVSGDPLRIPIKRISGSFI